MARILITGAAGFAGRYLARRLAGGADELFGGELDAGRLPAADELRKQLALRELDVRDEDRIVAILADLRPDLIYHMAAVVPIAIALETPAAPLTTNVIGTVNLLQAVRKARLSPRIVISGSSEEYGLIHPDEVPVTEDQPLRPSNPYAVSKVAQTLLGLQYHRSCGLDVRIGRAFNLTGPGQSVAYACPAFARQVAEIEAGLAEPVVRVGNLSPRRDYNDIRDIVAGYALIADRGRPGGVYNICTGKAVSMRQVLDKLLAKIDVDVRVEVDPSRVRPAENELIVGDNSRIAELGYRPAYEIDRTLDDLLDHWRRHLADKEAGA